MAGIGAAIAGGDATAVTTAIQAGSNAAANNYASHSPFAIARRVASAENARLVNECGVDCTQQALIRIDQQVAKVEVAANLAAIGQRSNLTGDQAGRLAQTMVELLPFYGSAESVAQIVTGQSSLTGEEANRIWAAVGLLPGAGGMISESHETFGKCF